jgi:hypothetical protein
VLDWLDPPTPFDPEALAPLPDDLVLPPRQSDQFVTLVSEDMDNELAEPLATMRDMIGSVGDGQAELATFSFHVTETIPPLTTAPTHTPVVLQAESVGETVSSLSDVDVAGQVDASEPQGRLAGIIARVLSVPYGDIANEADLLKQYLESPPPAPPFDPTTVGPTMPGGGDVRTSTPAGPQVTPSTWTPPPGTLVISPRTVDPGGSPDEQSEPLSVAPAPAAVQAPAAPDVTIPELPEPAAAPAAPDDSGAFGDDPAGSDALSA